MNDDEGKHDESDTDKHDCSFSIDPASPVFDKQATG
jgi:hypothetical protein